MHQIHINKPTCTSQAGYFFYIFAAFADFLFKINFFKISFKNTIRVSKGLYPDQGRRSVSADLDLNCLQRFSLDDKSRSWQGILDT